MTESTYPERASDNVVDRPFRDDPTNDRATLADRLRALAESASLSEESGGGRHLGIADSSALPEIVERTTRPSDHGRQPCAFSDFPERSKRFSAAVYHGQSVTF